MSQKYRPELIKIVRERLPGLEHDVQNTTTPHTARSMFEEMLFILKALLYDAITNANEAAQSTPKTPFQSAPPLPPQIIPQVIRPTIPSRPATPPNPSTDSIDLPPLHHQGSPTIHPSATSAILPTEASIQRGVANVIVTSQGTQVVSPIGTVSRLPPGAPIPLEATSDVSPELPPPPEDGINVILPPGGGMPPETIAALGLTNT